MADLDPRRAIGQTEGGSPRPEFIAGLRARVEAEARAQSTGVGTAAVDVTVIEPVPVLDDRTGIMKNNPRLLAALAAVAAIVALIVGVIIASDDDDGTIDTIETPDDTTAPDEPAPTTSEVPDDGGTSGVDDNEPPPSDTTTSTTEAPPPPEPELRFDVWDAPGSGGAAELDGTLWAPFLEEGVVRTFDVDTGDEQATYAIAEQPTQAHAAFGSIWVTDDAGSVIRVDPEDGSIVAAIEVGGASTWIDASEDSIWATQFSLGTVTRIDPSSNSVVATIDVAPAALGTMFSDGVGYTFPFQAMIGTIDPATNEASPLVDGGFIAGGWSAGPGGVWVGISPDPTVVQVDPATGELSDPITIPGADRVGGTNNDAAAFYTRFRSECTEEPPIVCGSGGIARIDNESGEIETLEFPDGIGASGTVITRGEDGDVWLVSRDHIIRVTYGPAES
ncbi:MAG: hypothetical protein AAF548_02040 [Actinomycetota bacterium]